MILHWDCKYILKLITTMKITKKERVKLEGMTTNRPRQDRGRSTKYKDVFLSIKKGKETWRGQAKGSVNFKYFDTEREAAIFVDKTRIEQGKNPVNVLTKH